MAGERLPDFLVVGAQKCGTTSVYHYLAQHPDVFMCPVKETSFIFSQLHALPPKGPGDEKNRYVKEVGEFQRLFVGSGQRRAVGESSADNLICHERSAPLIRKIFGDIRIIALLRNPVDRAFSCWTYLSRDARETLSFEEGLAAEERRRQANWYSIWFYRQGGLYYDQVKTYKKTFGRVGVFLFEDLKKHHETLIRSLFEFLEVDPGFQPDTTVRYNVSGIPRSRWLHGMLRGSNPIKSFAKKTVLAMASKGSRRRLKERLMAANLRKQTLAEETRESLRGFFREDILRLQDLLDRDLTLWLQ